MNSGVNRQVEIMDHDILGCEAMNSCGLGYLFSLKTDLIFVFI
jgi:hypothetical protein